MVSGIYTVGLRLSAECKAGGAWRETRLLGLRCCRLHHVDVRCAGGQPRLRHDFLIDS